MSRTIRSTAVSYTHLDVYKRQPRNIGAKSEERRLCRYCRIRHPTLDVYKRQAIASSEEIGEAVIIKTISPTVDEDIPVEDEIFEVVEKNPEFSYNGMSLMQYLGKSIKYPTIAPVSYTHLDVYKRQPPRSAGSFTKPPSHFRINGAS